MKRSAVWPTLLAAAGASAVLGGCYDIIVGHADECEHGGETYLRGDRFPASDGCGSCVCDEDGKVSCTAIGCVDPYDPCEDKACGETCRVCDPQDADCVETEEVKYCSAGGECRGTEPSCDGCEYGGEIYQPGETFPSEDGCNTCGCDEDGRVACTLRACLPSCDYAGNTYRTGESFPSEDGCNTCTCDESGRVACTARACAYDPCGGKACGDSCSLCPPNVEGCVETADLKYCNGEGECVGGAEPSCAACEYDGKTYRAGETFPDVDGCNTCRCGEDGGVECTLLACPPQGGSCQLGNITLQDGEGVVCPDGCNGCGCNDGLIAQTLVLCPPLPRIELCDGPAEDEVGTVTPIYLDGDAWALEIAYGGGCEEHALRLCTDGSFMESSPVQLRVWVVDDGEPDPCDAWITEQKVFDLSPVRRLYEEAYQTSTGSVVLNAKNGSETYSF